MHTDHAHKPVKLLLVSSVRSCHGRVRRWVHAARREARASAPAPRHGPRRGPRHRPTAQAVDFFPLIPGGSRAAARQDSLLSLSSLVASGRGARVRRLAAACALCNAAQSQSQTLKPKRTMTQSKSTKTNTHIGYSEFRHPRPCGAGTDSAFTRAMARRACTERAL